MRRAILFVSFVLCALAAAAQTITLDQNWELLPDPDAKYNVRNLPAQGWRSVRVGLSWNAQFDDMRDFGGVGWYRTAFAPAQLSTRHHVLLSFGACDYFCEVFVNGNKAGEHEGGYTPFEFDLSSKLRSDANEVIVRVTDPPRDPKRNQQLFPKLMYDELPHGKQHWYVQTGGLWQTVLLHLEPSFFIRALHVTSRIDGTVEVVVLTAAFGGDYANTAQIAIRDPQGAIVAHNEPSTDRAALQGGLRVNVSHPQLWSPDSPSLYTAEVSVGDARASVRFGFRSLTTRDGKLYLNGKPFFMIGALDQDFYPATIYTPPSPEYLRDEMRKAKALGLNTLRCHIKICTPDYLDAADEVGMLIWYEIPSWNDEHHWTQQAADRGMKVFREALDRDWNHPSLAIQSIINESWGADLKQPAQRQWLAATYDEAKKLVAPLGRLIDDNSACCENFHVKSDLADFHQYYSIPDHAEQWSKWVQDFASRPKWIWSPYGDAQPSGNEPLIVSEFGNWGLPKLPCGGSEDRNIGSTDHRNNAAEPSRPSDDQMIRSSDCTLPWWFSRDFNGCEITMPAGVIDRFHQFKLDRIFSSYNELAEATQWHQFESLKYEIEKMRSHPNIQGYVITEFTDVNWESNGLMDIWRNPKVYAKALSEIQQPDVVLSGPSRNVTSGDIVGGAPPVWSHRSGSDMHSATLEWAADWGVTREWPASAHNPVEERRANEVDVESATPFLFTAPDVNEPTQHRTTTSLRDRNGTVISGTQQYLNVFPKRHTAPTGVSVLNDAPNYLRNAFRANAGAATLIATKWNDAVATQLNAGRTVILLADSADALPSNFAVQIKPRERNNYDGNWISNFNWILPSSPVYRDIAFNKIMGFEAQAVTPNFVLLGLKPEQFDDVLSGAFYGWIHDNAALVLQAQYGKGKLLITTLRFDQYGEDPYATYLLDNMIRYVASPQFAPKLTLAPE
jgi:hypothetical protein